MKGNKNNDSKRRSMLSIKHTTKKHNIKKHTIKDKKYLHTAIALSDTTYSIKHEGIQICSSNIKRLQESLCKPVSVVIQRLSQEMIKKYLYTTNNQYKSKISYKIKRLRSKHKQSDIISRKPKTKKLQLNNDIDNIFDTNDKRKNTSFNLTNNICVDDESDNEEKNSDQRINKEDVLKNVESLIMLSNPVILNQVDENKLISKRKVQKTPEHVISSENIIDNNICKQNSYAHDDTESVHSLPKMNDELSSIKEVDKNEKCLDKWRYKRKYMCHEESNDVLNSVKNQRKRKKKSKLHHKDLEQTILLNHLNPTDNEVTISNLHLYASYSNIIDSKVVLTKLEDVYDNEYIINWKKKYAQQFLLFQNSQYIEQEKDSSINISLTKIVHNSHEDATKDSESNMNTEIGLNSCILPSKHEQSKSLKVLLVKLEKLGVSLKEQNLVLKIEHLTTQYINHYKINFINHSNNVLAHNSEVSSINDECIDEALAQLNPSEKENNIMTKYPLSKHANQSNASIIQLKQNSSSPKKILQNVYNLETSSEISSCSSEKSNVWFESTENIKYPEVCTSTSINQVEEISNLSKSPQIIQDEDIFPKVLLQTHLQRYLDRVPVNSSLKEVNSLTVSNEILKQNSELKEAQISPSLISEHIISPKKCYETLKLTNVIDYENITILQNDKKTQFDEDKQNTLENDTDEENTLEEDIEDSPLSIIDENSNVNSLTKESVLSVFKETDTKSMPVDNIDISTESSILHDVENIEDTGLLNETSVNNDSKKIISRVDEKIETDVSNINLSKNVQTKEINALQSNITTSDNSIFYECVACDSSFTEFKTLQSHLKKCLKERKNGVNNAKFEVSKDNENILQVSIRSDITESNSQEHDNNGSVLSTFSTIPSISTISKTKTKKFNHENRHRDKRSRRKPLKYNNKNTQCTVCSEVFDSIISLSNHIYGHTEKELQQAYEIAKRKQGLKNGSDSNTTTNSNEKTQTSTNESSSTSLVDSTMVESLQSDLKNKTNENTENKIISMEKMKLNENESKQVENSLEPLTIQTNKQVSEKISKVHERNSIKYCACHKNEFENKPSIELILLCNICKILFKTRECFEAHFENTETYLCNTKRLTSREPKLYCSVCQVILYSLIGMRQHMENHLKNLNSIKLFCHICKVRFIGMGSLFNLHWFNHVKNVCYVASVSNFPKISVVDSTSLEWSIITSDQFEYLIVTEHICNFCNAQCFSKNQLQNHLSYCTKNSDSKLPSIMPANNYEDQSTQSELDLCLFCNICNLTFSQKSLYEEHTASHKNNLQYICSPTIDVKKKYICNVCANVYENLKEFMIHWQDHNMVHEGFTCNQCKIIFSNLKTYLEHSKQCDTSIINTDKPSCQVTYQKMDFTCKICNFTFDSSKVLHQHTCIHSEESPNLNTVHSNNLHKDSNEQEISFIHPTELQPNLIEPMTISTRSTDEITTNDSAAPVNENRSEVSENKNVTINQSIDSSKSSTNSKSVDPVKTEFNDISLSDCQSIIDQDLESFLSISDKKTDDSNATEINYFVRNDRPSVLMNKSEEKEKTTACNVNNDLDKYDSRKDSNDKNTVIVKSPDLKKKDVFDKNPPPSEKINIKTTQDDVILTEPKIPEKNQNNSEEIVKPTTSLQPNNSTATSEKSVETKKYLRVKNISELIDQKLTHNSYNKNDQDGNTNILASLSMAVDLLNHKQTENLNIEPHPTTEQLNVKKNSVPAPSKSYKMIIIDHSPTEKQAVYVPCYESERPKEDFVCSAPAQKTTQIPAPQLGQIATSIPTTQSEQRAIPIPAQQSEHNTIPQSRQKAILIPTQRETPIPTQRETPIPTQSALPILVLQSGQRAIPIPAQQSAPKATPIPALQSGQRAIPILAQQSVPKATPIPASQSGQRPILASQSGQRAIPTLALQSGQRATPIPASQLGQKALPTIAPKSGQGVTPIPASQSGQRVIPVSQSGQSTTLVPASQSGQRATSIPASQSGQKPTLVLAPYSAQTATSIPASYSIRTASAMPILQSSLLSATPFTASNTVQSQIPNVLYSSIKPDTINSYSMNSRIINAATYDPSIITQPQNVSQNQSTLIASSSSIMTNSSINSYINNTYMAQSDNTVLCKTASTSMICNVQLANNFSNQNLQVRQPHDTHSTVKLQNAVHNTYSNRTAKVLPVNMRSQNSTESYMNNEASSLPVSSGYNYYYNTSNVKYPSMNVGNLGIMKTQYSKQDNNLTNNGANMQRQSNNLLQMSTFRQSVVSNFHSVMSSQQSHVHYQPSTSVGNSQFMHSLYVCRFCPKIIQFSTIEEFECHLNLYHNFFCNICNIRLYNSNDMDSHKLKHDSLLF